MGSVYAGLLAAAGNDVTVAVRHPDAANFLRVQGDVGQVVPAYADVRDATSVAAALAGAQAAINLVAILSERRQGDFDAVIHGGAATVASAAAPRSRATASRSRNLTLRLHWMHGIGVSPRA